jgi:hypothetical protein
LNKYQIKINNPWNIFKRKEEAISLCPNTKRKWRNKEIYQEKRFT